MTFSNAINFFRRNPLYVENLGISQSAGTTFNVIGGEGSALSASNPAFVCLESKATPGIKKVYRVTANQSFTQTQLGNNLFSITSGVNISVDMPFYLYAVSNANNGENTIAFMISRIPNRKVSPVAGNIGQSGNTNASTQGSFFSLASITAADYATSPCICVGSFRMQYTGGGTNRWTIQTIANTDGIGQFQEGVVFSFPRGQFGAAATKVFTDNGGTAPDQTTGGYVYFITKEGNVRTELAFPAIDVAGVGAVTLTLANPLKSATGGAQLFGFATNPLPTSNVVTGDITSGGQTTTTLRITSGVSLGILLNNNFPVNTSMSLQANYGADLG